MLEIIYHFKRERNRVILDNHNEKTIHKKKTTTTKKARR